ncbi:hypothetical protein ACQ4LE_010095 [Meloidogyne hapla]|uniref:Uncharacterized protein n=1 Tax=Meloidogyne hapla TaxID=6305 RepID=A0A1I8AXL7_MELHA
MNEELNNNNKNIDISLQNPPTSPPSYYLPSSPAEVFIAYSLGESENNLKIIEKETIKDNNLKQQNNDFILNTNELKQINEREENEEDEIIVVESPNEEQKYALLKSRTRLYRTLVWLQFSMTVFTCIFIMAIMVLVALILIMLQRTIDRADTAIRDNPVSQLYTKIRSAVDKIHM